MDLSKGLVYENHKSEAEEVKIHKSVVYRGLKRGLDIFLSLAGLLVLSPVFLVTAAAIAVEDGGPVFYKQRRIGKEYKEFFIYKFRSMRKDAEQIHEQMRKDYAAEHPELGHAGEVSFKLKIEEDPRITRVGKIIRKTNVDELPQLLNILKGHMSLVGPRPLPVYEYEEERSLYGKEYAERYLVPQGLTCTWQIAERDEITFEDRMKMDVLYARDCGLKEDLLIICKTAALAVMSRTSY